MLWYLEHFVLWEMKDPCPTFNHMFSLCICAIHAISAGPQNDKMVVKNVSCAKDFSKKFHWVFGEFQQTPVMLWTWDLAFLLSICFTLFPSKDSLSIPSNIYSCSIWFRHVSWPINYHKGITNDLMAVHLNKRIRKGFLLILLRFIHDIRKYHCNFSLNLEGSSIDHDRSHLVSKCFNGTDDMLLNLRKLSCTWMSHDRISFIYMNLFYAFLFCSEWNPFYFIYLIFS